jgi:hypothetical protein
MRIVARAVLVVVALAVAAAAYGQPRPGGRGPSGGGGGGGGAPAGLVVKIDAQKLAQLMNDAGFASKVIDNGGVTVVLVTFWNDQIFSGAIPQACEKDGSGCRSFKLFANLGKDTGVDDAWINAWNRSYYYVRAFKLPSGELVFEWNVALLTGLTPDYIKLAALAFKSAVDDSTDFKPK